MSHREIIEAHFENLRKHILCGKKVKFGMVILVFLLVLRLKNHTEQKMGLSVRVHRLHTE